MIPHPSDPERAEVIDFRKLRMDQCWRKREILDNTYLRSLLILGYKPDEAATELSLLKMEGK